MNFQDLLKDYLTNIGCTQADLATQSKLSSSTISRYLSGERIPVLDSEQLENLAEAISTLATTNTSNASYNYSKDAILEAFTVCISQKDEQYKIFLSNFSAIITSLDIKIKDLANATNFETSFIYRIISGERRPSSVENFSQLVAGYIIDTYSDIAAKKIVAQAIGVELEDISTNDQYAHALQQYFFKNNSPSEDDKNAINFLTQINEFNLDEYIEVIHFNDIKTPTIPIQLPISKHYYGIEQMRKAELDFFKTTVLSTSTSPIFMFGDMPMVEMAEDLDFGKKWMFGIAASLKKGHRINIIHDLNRPFEEMMLGLEAWIPVYMTGQVSPYHLEDYKNNVFHQINYVSGVAALFGECIENHHSEGRYYLTTNKSEIAYYSKKADAILKHAKPLMDIYDESRKSSYSSFLNSVISDINCDLEIISGSLPSYTLPDQLLNKCISKLDPATQNEIKRYIKQSKDNIEHILATNQVTVKYHVLSKEEFEKSNYTLSFPDLFITDVSKYTYEDYLMHLEATKSFANTNANYNLINTTTNAFINLDITIAKKHFFIVSKYKSPNIHFVIHHKRLLSAIENFYIAKQD